MKMQFFLQKLTLTLQTFLLLAAISIPLPSLARSVWIEVVGIEQDSNKIRENFEFFYNEAESFLKTCSTSKLKPECILFLNSDWSLAGSSSEKIMGKHLPPSETPTKVAVLNLLEDKLKTSIPGDTVIFVLTSHGSISKSANSCIVINSQESICETDLVSIVQKKPAGVTLFINAEGCFSGAFVDLTKPEVCTAIRSDRRNGSLAAGGFFWEQILQNKWTSLVPFGQQPLGNNYRQTSILGSHSIKSLMCRKLREQTFKNWPQALGFAEAMADEKPWLDNQPIDDIKSLPPVKNTTFFNASSYLPEFNREVILYLESQSRGFLQFLHKAKSEFRCEKVGFTKELCAHLEMVLGTHFYNEIQQLQKQLAHLLQAPKTGQFQDMQKYNQHLKALLLENSKTWLDVEPCFFNVEQTIDSDEMAYQKTHRSPSLQIFPRDFNEKDLSDAKTCEQQIKF